METPICPECVGGKHRVCIGWTLDADDDVVDCECECSAKPTQN